MNALTIPPPAPYEPPAHLSETAKTKWHQLTPILAAHNCRDQGTLDALAAYCAAYAQWCEAQAKVNELGPVVKGPAGFAILNPFVQVSEKAQQQMRLWAAELRRL